jgi:hypothetical protein
VYVPNVSQRPVTGMAFLTVFCYFHFFLSFLRFFSIILSRFCFSFSCYFYLFIYFRSFLFLVFFLQFSSHLPSISNYSPFFFIFLRFCTLLFPSLVSSLILLITFLTLFFLRLFLSVYPRLFLFIPYKFSFLPDFLLRFLCSLILISFTSIIFFVFFPFGYVLSHHILSTRCVHCCSITLCARAPAVYLSCCDHRAISINTALSGRDKDERDGL